ncbi:MAG: XRE family transcriptional regulator [Maledivibacter sp.]|jgi:transcriptional regulator with XRE-family HTH domain|nr:XRE family transcriptional regulator [Maledivibacter sp.]
MEKEIGKKIKELRISKDLTLKDLSEQTELSIGYLSQLERGLTSPAISSLQSIAQVLGIHLSYFFALPKENNTRIIRSFEQKIFQVQNSKSIFHSLSNDVEGKNLSPMLVTILPSESDEDITSFSHEGEEFLYVLEGILTVLIDNKKHLLYPGDSMHIQSKTPHNWGNSTNKTVKFLTVNTPKLFEIHDR